MPFGKHKGQLLTAIPTSYLVWLFREADLDAPLYDAVRRELSARTDGRVGAAPERTTAATPAVVDLKGILKKWRNEMAMLYHPDRNSGDDGAMRAINHGYDRLLEMIEAMR
jgi:hypothetical protein